MINYSILAIPPEPVYGQLYKIIKELSKKYDGPLFEPHLTILGNIEKDLTVIEKGVEKLTKFYAPLELVLDRLSFSTTYFQSVFVRVKSTAGLMQCNLELKKFFDVENSVFMPHISLLYGNHNMLTREKVVSEIKIHPTSITIKDLVILSSSSPNPEEWKIIKTVSFKGKG